MSNLIAFGSRARNHEPAPGKQLTERAVYTVVEVAQLLSLSRGTAYALVRDGTIPALRLGNRWVIPRGRFHAWLDSLDEEQRRTERRAALMAHIVPTAAGGYRANWRDAAGRQRAKTFPTKREAKAYLAEVETAATRGLYVDPHAGRIRFGAYAARWLTAR